MRFWTWAVALIAAAAVGGCATTATPAKPAAKSGGEASKPKPLAPGLDPLVRADAFPSTYKPMPSRPTAVIGAAVFTGTGVLIENGVVLVKDGRIEAVGPNLPVPAGYETVDGKGKWVTPGLIDAHSHLGVYASPSVPANSDGNELTNPVTAEVWAEHSVWPQDPGFNTARIGGGTTLLVLPGSGNLIGGRGVVLRNVPARTVQDMKFPDAPYALKMACGENPKRVYGSKNRAPSTRMGNVAGYRQAWINAADYARKWDVYRAKAGKDDKAEPPKRDLGLDTLASVLRGEIQVENHCYRADEMVQMIDISKEFGYHIAAFHHAVEAYKIADILAANDICVATWANWWGSKMEMLDGEILVQNHCYRADEMANVLDMAREFGYHVSAFHHAVEAYKIADLLKANGTCAAVWADWWGFKMEAYDAISENLALLQNAGACAMIHSDDENGIQRLNQEVGKALAAGRRAGIQISDATAWEWLTINPARALGIDDKTGSLKPGKMADLVLWNGNPFSVYSRPEKVWIDGALLYDANDPARRPVSDFELGQPGAGDVK